MESVLKIRPVIRNDIDTLAEIERAAWGGLGTPILTQEDLSEWYEERSPFFMVAEDQQGIGGYCFARIVASPGRGGGVLSLLDPSRATGQGMIDCPHDPEGTAVYGISIASVRRGAGRILIDAVHALLDELQIEQYFSLPRLAGLDDYLKPLEETNGPLPYAADEVALWYAHESARMLQLRIWSEARRPQELSLPPPSAIDPVLGFHTRGTTCGVIGIVPNYMNDPASRNYGALVFSAYPHR